MRLPRRVPWVSSSELENVCAWIFADDADLASQTRAINRLSAWQAITALPHALESTLALLSATAQDAALNDPQASSSAGGRGAGGASSLALRQAYSSALVRHVNGLVDPLQLGAYARSIATIAAQLGLPAWLVALRHAATHEELPSLEVLREGARQALAWLLHNYFLPILSPSSSTMSPADVSLRPIAPLLKRYKTLLKLTTRDAALTRQCAPAVTAVLRDVERWIGEAQVAAAVRVRGTGEGWDVSGGGKGPLDGEGNGSGQTADDEAGREMERWALERTCDALLARGALVPVSKKKRALPSDPLALPPTLLALWRPLLQHLHTLHPTLPSVLLARALLHLEGSPVASPSSAPGAEGDQPTARDADLSYDLCVAAWAAWVVDTYDAGEEESSQDSSGVRRNDVVMALLKAIGPRARGEFTRAVEALCAGQPNLEAAVSLLPHTSKDNDPPWLESDLATMDSRLQKLLQIIAPREEGQPSRDGDVSMQDDPDTTLEQEASSMTHAVSEAPDLPPGWRLVDNSQWRAAPMGVFVVV